MQKRNPEFCLLGIVLNFPEYFEKIKKSGNIFLNKNCHELYNILVNEKSFNKQTILEIIKTKNVITEDDFLEIYNSEYQEDHFNIYYEYVLTNYSRQKLYQESINIYKNKIKNVDEMRLILQNLLNNLDINQELDNITSKEIIQQLAKEQIRMIKSEFPFLDQYGGYETTDLIYIAGRPGTGKTSLILNLIKKHLSEKQPIGIFSLEIKPKRIMMSLACMDVGIPEWRIKMNLLNSVEKQRYYESLEKYYNDNLVFGQKFDITSIAQKVKKMKKENKIELLYIDYLGQITGGEGKTKYEQTGDVSRKLKKMAFENEIPIVCLCQLNRESVKGERKPRISDLRDSGNLEQDADVIVLLSEKCILDADKFESIIECDFAKNRNNPIGSCEIYFNKKLRKMSFNKKND